MCQYRKGYWHIPVPNNIWRRLREQRQQTNGRPYHNWETEIGPFGSAPTFQRPFLRDSNFCYFSQADVRFLSFGTQKPPKYELRLKYYLLHVCPLCYLHCTVTLMRSEFAPCFFRYSPTHLTVRAPKALSGLCVLLTRHKIKKCKKTPKSYA